MLSNSSYGKYLEIESISISRQDGQPDTCGDPEVDFPPDPPLDPSDFTEIVTINNYNNNGDVIGSNEYEINYTPTFAPNFEFNVDLGGTEINTNFRGFGDGGGGANTSGSDTEEPELEEEAGEENQEEELLETKTQEQEETEEEEESEETEQETEQETEEEKEEEGRVVG